MWLVNIDVSQTREWGGSAPSLSPALSSWNEGSCLKKVSVRSQLRSIKLAKWTAMGLDFGSQFHQMVVLETYQEQCQNTPDVHCAAVGILRGRHTSPKWQRHYGSKKCTQLILKHSAAITYLLPPQLNIDALSKQSFSRSEKFWYSHVQASVITADLNEFCWRTSWMGQTTLLSLALQRSLTETYGQSKFRWA